MAPLSLLTGAITRAAKASSMSRSVVMARQAMAAKTAYGARSYSSGHEEESYEVRQASLCDSPQGGDTDIIASIWCRRHSLSDTREQCYSLMYAVRI